MRDPKILSSRGPSLSASVTSSVSALASRSSPRSLGSASNASAMTRVWARFRVAGRERGGGLGPALVEGCCEPGVGADPAVGVTGGGGQPGRGRPVAGGLGDVVGGGQHPELLGLGAGDHPRQPDQQLLLLTGRAELRARPRRGRPTHRRSEPGARCRWWTWDKPTIDHRQRVRAQNPLSTRDSEGMLRGFEARRWRSSHLNRRSVVAGFRDGPDGPPRPAGYTGARRVLKAASVPGVR